MKATRDPDSRGFRKIRHRGTPSDMAQSPQCGFLNRVRTRTTDEGDLQMKMSLRFTESSALVLIMGTACFGQHYTQINLVSSTSGVARVTDPQLINPWGMS